MKNMRPVFDTEQDIFMDEVVFFEHEGKNFVRYSYTRKIEDSNSAWIDYDKVIFEESKEILLRISNALGLGEVSLKKDECEIYPPSFHIKVDSSLNAKDRINLRDDLMRVLYIILRNEDKLEYLKKFFVKLDF